VHLLVFLVLNVVLADIRGFKFGYRLILTCVCWPGWKQIHRLINSSEVAFKLVCGGFTVAYKKLEDGFIVGTRAFVCRYFL